MVHTTILHQNYLLPNTLLHESGIFFHICNLYNANHRDTLHHILDHQKAL
jgi:hypothetical protein